MVPSAGGKGRFLPAIYWKEDKESRYLAFLTPVAEVPRLPIHMIRTSNGWRTFVCRKVEIFEDENPQGECPICDEFKKAPQIKYLALAVELTPVEERKGGRRIVTGFEVLMDEWESENEGKTEKREAPHVGIVSQALMNFWTPFTAKVEREVTKHGVGDLNEIVYEVQRLGKGKNGTTYVFEPYEADMRPDLSEFEFPSLEDWIEQKGSLEYYEEELSGGVEDEEDSSDDKPATRAKGDQSDATSRFDELRAKLEEREAEEEPAESTA